VGGIVVDGRVAVLITLLEIIGAVALVVSTTLVAAWLDSRAATEQQHALDDLRRYGPLAPGLRVELLPARQRAQVRQDRQKATPPG
jgi:hypothetical protein